MSLKDWEQRNKWLTSHTATKSEIIELLAVGDRDLQDSRVQGVSADGRMSHAYAAAQQFASAALTASGYRPTRGSDHHYRVIQSLALTIGWSAADVKTLDAFRKKRNVSSYERTGNVSDRDAQEIQELAARLRADLITWLRAEHAELL